MHRKDGAKMCLFVFDLNCHTAPQRRRYSINPRRIRRAAPSTIAGTDGGCPGRTLPKLTRRSALNSGAAWLPSSDYSGSHSGVPRCPGSAAILAALRPCRQDACTTTRTHSIETRSKLLELDMFTPKRAQITRKPTIAK
jgi:hypothetical protein